ncbi:MAG: hypothetical protein ACP5HM_04655 [Anaerolineae bacterium]
MANINQFRVVLLCLISLALMLGSVSHVNAQEGLPPLTEYNQDFNTLASTPDGGTTNTGIPNGWTFVEFDSNADTNYRIDEGSNNQGDTYSYGSVDETDRAFGALNSGSLQSSLGVEFQNNTGGTIGQLAISYYCEMWRQGSTGRTDRLDFQYSTDATSLTDGTWIDFDSLDCLGTDTGSTGAKDGNTQRSLINGTITGLSIADGETFWLRWTTYDASSSDDGLAIDDFVMNEFTPNAITLSTLTAEAATSPALLIASVLLLGAAIVWRRKRA